MAGMPILKKRAITLALILGFVVNFWGCPNNNSVGVLGQTVIRVDDNTLTLSEFNAFFEPIRMNYHREENEGDKGLQEARARFFLELLEEMIILRRAEELGIQVTSQELQQALKNIETDYEDQVLQDMFLSQAISPDDWKERVRRQLLVEKVLNLDLGKNISVELDEMQQYYDEHQEAWSYEEQLRVFHMLLPNRKEANTVLQKIKKGEAFEALAKQHSTAPEAPRGGDLGYVARGHLPEKLEAAVFSLKKDSISPVIKTSYGYHIFKVVEKKPAGKRTMDERIEEIRERVKQEKIEKAYGPWLTNLRSRYKIAVNREII
jgi:parvulin-like peptidyl-prolyl isomerase